MLAAWSYGPFIRSHFLFAYHYGYSRAKRGIWFWRLTAPHTTTAPKMELEKQFCLQNVDFARGILKKGCTNLGFATDILQKSMQMKT